MRAMRLFVRCWVLLATAAAPALAAADDWVDLFDGKTLEGWTQRNGTATYRVEEGCVVGKTNEGSPNSFLCTDKDYGNFELTFEVKVDDELNSGVQIRSKSIESRDSGRVHGPQVEISTDGMAGHVYGESLGTGWISPDPQATDAFRAGEWNRYRIVAEGNRIRTWINDKPVADIVDDKSGHESGFIGLQVHGIAAGTGPFEVRWKNIRLREIE
ncbi:MAG TPA: DUF1080 domain-containing protein [Pirellulaceae bacterium]|nr:DUF1080 domain-containing protein [Pirellulaceae bacterium]